MTCKQRPGSRERGKGYLEGKHSSQRHCKCKGPEVGVCLRNNKKARAAGVGNVRGNVQGNVVGKVEKLDDDSTFSQEAGSETFTKLLYCSLAYTP